ncbi:multidrug resistance protein MDR [Talaromyces proteolyticus]|uniref:Multidrug resistance protein MDR n=1 Tax=Talaromyces proteolyticus TaxID=1131652 RepID=A0AAD4KWJ7_9EURO|nr:multidrug resistance protein MDR [Talaromyces proteolyticus]KAH8701635.1 multidrug resistance protein MDR [Talaromyces proteolyticus]
MDNIELCADNNFGPQVSRCPRGFDFTLLFEESFFSIAPSVLVLLALSFRHKHLWKKKGKKVGQSPEYWAKIVFAQAFGACQLSLLVIWALPDTPRTRTSLPAAVLALIASVGLQLLSHFEHFYSIQPSFLLNLFLSLSLLIDVVRVRTLWLAQYIAIAGIYTVGIALKLIWFYLESRTKQASFIDRKIQYGTEEVRSLYSRSFFWWINGLFFSGFQGNLSVQELPHLDQAMSSCTVHRVVRQRWDSVSKSRKNALAWCTLGVFKSSVAHSFLSRFALIGLNYSQPFLITRLINYVGGKGSDRNDGYGLIGAFALVFILKAILNGIYEHYNFRFITQIRGAMVSMIYEKTLTLPSKELNDLLGITLMSNEIDNIASGIQNAHEIWASPIELVVAIYLLERQLLWAAAIPALISLIAFYFTSLISKSFPRHQKAWMQTVRERVAFTSHYLDISKTIKMLGVSEQISTILRQLRVHELNLQKKFRHSMVMMNLLAGTTSNLSPVITLSIYTGIAFRTSREPLTEAETFMTLSIISLATSPLSNLIYSAPRLHGAIECFQRIQEHLLESQRREDQTINAENISCEDRKTKLDLSGPKPLKMHEISAEHTISKVQSSNNKEDPIVLHQADFGLNDITPVLSKISLKFHHASLTMVIGPVGSGKSALLNAILGEIPCSKGSVQVKPLRIAFCDGKPWIRHKTIRDNICGPLAYDQEWYQRVIYTCALADDIKILPKGDLTLVGSNGTAISGGQRQRIAIARAIYSRPQIAIFDDILSALDARTSEHVFKHVLGDQGILRQHQVTIIIATHAHQYLAFADQVVILQEGRITECGSPLEAQERIESVMSDRISSRYNEFSDSASPVSVQQSTVPCPAPHEVDDGMNRRLSDLRNYAYYWQAAGPGNMLLYFVFLIIGAFSSQFPNLWVQWWAENNARSPFGQLPLYISIYAVLAILASFLWASCMWLVFCRIVPKSSNNFHDCLVTKVKDAPLYFLASTDNGNILNRFSQDMTLVDRSLPADFLKTSNNFVQCMMSAVFISVGAKYIAPLIPVAGFIVYWIQKFYLRTSRQLRQLDLETKSPLYTQFTETINGLVTIRAFGWQKEFQEEQQQLLQASQRPFFTLYVIQRWLILVLDLFVAGIAIVLSILAVFVYNIGPIGVSLISLVTFSQQLTELVNFWTSMETSIGAISRIRGFEKAPSENLPDENKIPSPAWPSEGHLVFHNMSAGYQSATQPVLRNISLTVPAGTKLGVCGRTGSGKSSLVLAVLRMIEIQSGDLVIDGVSLQSCPRQIVRSRVTVISQEPVLFQRSVRDNVAGLLTVDDSVIFDALEKVHLRELVEIHGGLKAMINTLALSAGQKQLICLARAIVMKRKILLLDEATSNVDDRTEELMQRVIRMEFSDCTIIAIAHRVHTLSDFDNIAVFDEGRVAEYDKPAALLNRPGSLFREYYEQQSSAMK